MTGVFLGLLAQGKIDVSSWEEAQKGYNCLVIAIFRRMNKNYKLGDTLGSSVEEGAREIKDQYAKLKGDYDREFKKSKK
jgi:hypothetical protein